MSLQNCRVEIFSLLNFKRLAENDSNHAEMLSDFRIMQYVERGLETHNEEAVRTSLRILELLTENPKSCEHIKKIESMKASLKNVIVRPFGITPSFRAKAEKIVRAIDSSGKLSTKEKLTWPRKVITLQVTGLHNGTRKELEDILTKKVKGVLTVLIDVEHQRCTATIYNHVEPKVLAEAIAETGFMHAHQILRNHKNQEILVSLLDSPVKEDNNDLPEYLDEEDEEVQPQAIRPKDFRVAASEWFLTTAGFIQRSMYW